jgi:DNA-binding NarL/FixJ family response regulator
MEGLAGIFEERPGEGYAPLTPVFGGFEELLSDPTLLYLVVDLHAYTNGLETVDNIRRRRPDMRLIVIGPEGDDHLIKDLILAGVRAYTDQSANPQMVRKAIEEIISGVIWAPRRILSQLIDQLHVASNASLTSAPPRLTDRERQVLDLILTARSNREIAKELGIEEGTVQAHVGHLLRKTGAGNRIDLLLRTSDPVLRETAGIRDRRQGDRRRSDRRNGLGFTPPPITHQ